MENLTAKQRVEKEYYELREKFIKLDSFIYSLNFNKLSVREQQLLIKQRDIMLEYGKILVKRLEIWKEIK